MSNRLEHKLKRSDTTNVNPRKDLSLHRNVSCKDSDVSCRPNRRHNSNASFIFEFFILHGVEIAGLSSASSTGSNISHVFDIGPMRLQSECDKLPADEIVVMNLRVDDGNVIITPPHDSENYVLVFPCKTVRLEMADVWNLVIRPNVTKSISIKKDIEIEIRGWRDLPQQMTQLIAMMIQSGTRTCKRSSTFMEEMVLIECHPSYFNYIEDHLEKLNAMKTLLDWKKMSHFFTSEESNDCKYRGGEFSSYEFVKKYCERSVV